jgi:Uncharacterized protein conserved in bacteria (DUF2064).
LTGTTDHPAGDPAGSPGAPAEPATPRRAVGVLITADPAAAAPPGVDPDEFLAAVAEDTYEVVAGLELVQPVILHTGLEELAHEIAWPGTPVIHLADGALGKAFEALRPYGDVAAVVAGDAPDLPPLLIGKLLRELGRAPVAVCPAEDGTAVAIAARQPLPGWAAAELNDADVVRRLRAMAPGRRMVATGPGWHRLRRPADIHRLDPGLEGWEATRALLSAAAGPR